MSKAKLSDVAGISTLAVERYLNILGWYRNTNFPNTNLWVFENSACEIMRTIVIPASESFDDYSIGLLQMIQRISALYSKSEFEIIKELKGVYYDRLEIRIKSSISDEGKLPIEYAAQCIQGLKNLILYSACAEQEPRPICPKATLAAKNQLSKFELCQTEVGSFIINIDTQVVDDNFDEYKIFNIENNSFEHKIVKRIMTSLEQVDSAIKQDIKLTNLTANAYEKGITANICDSLLALEYEEQPIEIEATAKYASALMEKVGEQVKVTIDERHFGIIKEIANIYRDNTLTENVDIYGNINKMAKEISEEEPERTVYISTKIDGRYRTLKAALNEADHLIACDAYKNDNYVHIIGEIDMSQHVWEFISVSVFEIILDEI